MDDSLVQKAVDELLKSWGKSIEEVCNKYKTDESSAFNIVMHTLSIFMAHIVLETFLQGHEVKGLELIDGITNVTKKIINDQIKGKYSKSKH